MKPSTAFTYDVTIYAPNASAIYLDDAPAVGGAEQQTALLARSLAALGLRVAHAVTALDGLPATSNGVDLVAEAPPVRGEAFHRRVRRVIDVLRRADAGIYIQRSVGVPTGVVAAFARSRRRRFIYSASSSRDLTSGLPIERHEWLAGRIGLRLADALVVQTREQAESATRYRRVVQIPSFCEPMGEEGPGSVSRALVARDIFLWVGRPNPYKNPGAFVHLAASVPEAQFVLVGVSPDHQEADVRELLALGATLPNLEILPAVAPSTLASLYRRAVAVVNTSDFEGFPNTFMEGWRNGALVLSLHVDPDGVITHRRIGEFARGSQDELTQAARRMWSNRHQSEDSRRAAVQYVAEQHAPESVAKRWLELLSTLTQVGISSPPTAGGRL